MSKKKITVVGLGYVGLSNLLLFAPHHFLTGYDIDESKLEILKKGISPIKDPGIEEYLMKFYNTIKFDGKKDNSLSDADIVIIATPTDYNEQKNYFDTSSVVNILDDIYKLNPKALVVIKSTIPFGFTADMKKKYPSMKIIFSPEFLREGRALFDNLHPSRIVVGEKNSSGKEVGSIFLAAALDKDVPILYTDSREAESIKLFSNNYLAMRVSYFNELDSFAIKNCLNVKDIIDGVSADPRVGHGYNNPSFGYGGYCLPKDTKQLLANYGEVPQNLIQAIVDSNETRKNFIVTTIANLSPKTIGVYKLSMKQGSDNFRSSSIMDIVYKLSSKNIKIILFEPSIKDSFYEEFKVIDNFNSFIESSDLIIANRIDNLLQKYSDKVFTRDIFNEN